MTSKVGSKGQIVIDQDIRQQLGVEPGMLAVQWVVDEHLELRFVPGPHRRSLAGAARPFITRWPTDEELEDSDEMWSDEDEAEVTDRVEVGAS